MRKCLAIAYFDTMCFLGATLQIKKSNLLLICLRNIASICFAFGFFFNI